MKEQKLSFRGVYGLLLTPFKEDLSIDWTAYEQYVDWQCSHTPHYLFAVCGSSEMKDLNLEERIRLAEMAVQRSGGIPVVATANLESDPGMELEEIKRMEDTGVAGLVFTTKGMGEDQARMEYYLHQLSEQTDLPSLVYEFPGYPNHFMDAVTYGNLVKRGRIRGIKDTTCTKEGIAAKIAQNPESVVLQANIPWLLDSLQNGAGGVMATTSTSAVQVLMRLWEAVQSNTDEAEEIHEWLTLISSTSSPGFPATSKWLAALQGVPIKPIMRSGKTLPSQRVKAIHTLFSWAERNQILRRKEDYN